MTSWPDGARALRHHNFRLFFGGQTISLLGTWMQRLAVVWLIYRLTGSPFWLGLVTFAGQIPSFLVAPVAGVLADRWPRRRMLIASQILAMAQALILAALVLGDRVAVWHVVALSAVLGVVNGFDMPVRQSFMVDLVDDKADLGNAIALNSIMVNGTRILGPTAAGIIVATAGEGACFLANGVSFLAVIASLAAMRVPARSVRSAAPPVWRELVDGLRYAAGFEPIWALLSLVAIFSFAGMPYAVLMPVIVRELLGGGADLFGFLMGCSGVGAFLGAILLAGRRSVIGLGKVLAGASAAFAGALLGLAWSRNLTVSFALMACIGYGQMIVFAGSNTLLQSLVEDDKRGRVMSFYTMAFMGFTPVGNLAAGALAGWVGAPWAVSVCAVVFLAGSLLFARRLPVLRAKARPVLLARAGLPPDDPEFPIQGASERR